MRALLRWVLPILAVAAFIHAAALWATPRLVMYRVMHAVAAHAGSNQVLHAPPPTAANRGIPLPSPDLLYSTCLLDFAAGPIEISVTPGPSYLSLAVFDAATDNIFVTNDQSHPGQPIHLLIAGPGQQNTQVLPAATAVHVSTSRALLLLRALAATPELRVQAEAARRTLQCRVMDTK